jgi:hypothetical protein
VSVKRRDSAQERLDFLDSSELKEKYADAERMVDDLYATIGTLQAESETLTLRIASTKEKCATKEREIQTTTAELNELMTICEQTDDIRRRCDVKISLVDGAFPVDDKTSSFVVGFLVRRKSSNRFKYFDVVVEYSAIRKRRSTVSGSLTDGTSISKNIEESDDVAVCEAWNMVRPKVHRWLASDEDETSLVGKTLSMR